MSTHPSCVIDPTVRLPADVVVGPFSIIEAGVEVGAACVIGEHVVLRRGTILGEGCRVDAHCVVGGLPQDLRFDPATESHARLGKRVTLREGVTVHRATRAGGATSVGDEAFIMAYAHVAHDCTLGPNVIVANNVIMAGHVSIGAHAFVGGGAAIHQHTRVGEGCMVSGMSRVARDAPPFCLVAERDDLIGLNLVGLRRRGLSREEIRELKVLYRELFMGGVAPAKAARQALERGPWTAPATRLLEFCLGSRRGFAQTRRGGHVAEEVATDA